MNLTAGTAQVMHLAQCGKAEDALALAAALQESGIAAPPSDQAALWYAVAVAHHVQADDLEAFSACDRCIGLATEADSPGWISTGLSLRALSSARQGRVEAALLDLARAELELVVCDDLALSCWAHTGLGGTYLELRLYELAEPHLARAQELDLSPVPLLEAPVMDLVHLAELHVRWADEIERVHPDESADAEVGQHRQQANTYAVRALDLARRLPTGAFVGTCRALELCTQQRSSSPQMLADLSAAYATEDLADSGTRAAVGGALARCLWGVGRRKEALDVAREAAVLSENAKDWQTTASAQWLLVEMQAQYGVPGAHAGRAYAQMLSTVLWRQRLSTLQGARAALEVEGLHRDKDLAQRAATEDPLTGVGNRRVFDDALRAFAAEAIREESSPLVADLTPMSMLVIDLNDFKVINDTYGHVVGDEVLQVVAMAMRGVARADDVVARLGGDEFVVLARGADEEAGKRLATRLTEAIDALGVGTRDGVIRLSASVGVATTRNPAEVAELLAEADEAMYAVKRASVEERAELRPPRPAG